jgi:hypothetical protein
MPSLHFERDVLQLPFAFDQQGGGLTAFVIRPKAAEIFDRGEGTPLRSWITSPGCMRVSAVRVLGRHAAT